MSIDENMTYNEKIIQDITQRNTDSNPITGLYEIIEDSHHVVHVPTKTKVQEMMSNGILQNLLIN